jgi:hypothetical protein
VELDSATAAKWCNKYKIPELSPEAQAGLAELSHILLLAIHEAPDRRWLKTRGSAAGKWRAECVNANKTGLLRIPTLIDSDYGPSITIPKWRR